MQGFEEKSGAPASPERTRKTYRAPELSYYGDVSQLTRGSAGGMADGGITTKMCWIAEALYGADSPRTLLVRAWLAECYERGAWWARVAVPLYRRFGERVAAHVRSYPFLKKLFLPVFDRAIRQSHQEYAARVVLRQAA